MTDISKLSALVIDAGLYVHVAEKLAEQYAKVFYYVPTLGAFPSSRDWMIGQGLEIERVKHYEDLLDKVDLVVFPDIHQGRLQDYLRDHGYPVWGCGLAEDLETDRWWAKNLFGDAQIPTGDAERIVGIAALRDYLEEHEDVYVKGEFRGDLETFHSINGRLSQPKLDELAHRLGPYQEHMVFVVENSIPGVEVGYDGFSVDGMFPEIASFGYEAKDAGYIGKVASWKDLPEPLRYVNERIGPLLKELGMRGFLSTEIRVGKDKTPYLIDPACRAGSPPSESYIELFDNWGEIIWHAAKDGVLITPQPNGDIAAQIVLRSEFAREHALPVYADKEVLPWLKLHNKCLLDGQLYVAPLGFPQFGSVVAIADSLEEAVELVTERADQVEAPDLDWDRVAMERCLEQIKEGLGSGITW